MEKIILVSLIIFNFFGINYHKISTFGELAKNTIEHVDSNAYIAENDNSDEGIYDINELDEGTTSGKLNFVFDYPLIDVQLRYNDADIKLIIANNFLIPDTRKYLYTNDKEVLENLQLELKVLTFPKGRGTTPDSCLYIYEDNVLIKEIPFMDSYSDNRFKFEELTKSQVEEIIKQSLPDGI